MVLLVSALFCWSSQVNQMVPLESVVLVQLNQPDGPTGVSLALLFQLGHSDGPTGVSLALLVWASHPDEPTGLRLALQVQPSRTIWVTPQDQQSQADSSKSSE